MTAITFSSANADFDIATPLPRWGQQDASLLQIKPLKNGVQKIYPGYPHGMLTTNADIINPDLLAFIKG